MPASASPSEKMHLDIASNIAHLPTKTLILRAGIFFGWMLSFMGSMALIGLIPTVPLFIIAFMRIEGRERWTHRPGHGRLHDLPGLWRVRPVAYDPVARDDPGRTLAMVEDAYSERLARRLRRQLVKREALRLHELFLLVALQIEKGSEIAVVDARGGCFGDRRLGVIGHA